jgi:BirA family transcriptional regulator, biotin operon repressor / biotin---[acetyl-CoA-carboxylase] ligase
MPPDPWRLKALGASIGAALGTPDTAWPEGLVVALEALEQVDSTNTRLLAIAERDVAPTLRVLVAKHQSAGRGRMGRPWHSQAGESLTLSCSMPMPASMGSGVSLAVGVAIAQALDPIAVDGDGGGREPALLVKWPNDLWLRDAAVPWGGRKLGGILIETTGIAAAPVGLRGPAPQASRAMVVGVGLNLRRAAAWVNDTARGPTPAYGVASLDERGGSTDACDVLHRVVPALVAGVARYTTQGWSSFDAAWRLRDALAGRWVRAAAATPRAEHPSPNDAWKATTDAVEGRAVGVRDDGALLVQALAKNGTGDGQMHALTSGEVSLRWMPKPDATLGS